jgi:hypothetical protein
MAKFFTALARRLVFHLEAVWLSIPGPSRAPQVLLNLSPW